MAALNVTPIDPPSDPEDSNAGTALTSDECETFRAAAEAEGFSDTFADLLCRFAELIGAEQVLQELGQMKTRLKDDPPH